jgi:hypothetical protein
LILIGRQRHKVASIICLGLQNRALHWREQAPNAPLRLGEPGTARTL